MHKATAQADGFSQLPPAVKAAAEQLVGVLCKGGFIPGAANLEELLSDVAEFAVEMKEDLDPEFLAQVLEKRDHVVASMSSISAT